jgi:DNA-binding MurR/RpiR family transcriptional regulator
LEPVDDREGAHPPDLTCIIFTEACDLLLVAPSRETAYRTEALASRIAHIIILDAMWVALAVALGDTALTRARTIADVISEHRF